MRGKIGIFDSTLSLWANISLALTVFIGKKKLMIRTKYRCYISRRERYSNRSLYRIRDILCKATSSERVNKENNLGWRMLGRRKSRVEKDWFNKNRKIKSSGGALKRRTKRILKCWSLINVIGNFCF